MALNNTSTFFANAIETQTKGHFARQAGSAGGSIIITNFTRFVARLGIFDILHTTLIRICDIDANNVPNFFSVLQIVRKNLTPVSVYSLACSSATAMAEAARSARPGSSEEEEDEDVSSLTEVEEEVCFRREAGSSFALGASGLVGPVGDCEVGFARQLRQGQVFNLTSLTVMPPSAKSFCNRAYCGGASSGLISSSASGSAVKFEGMNWKR